MDGLKNTVVRRLGVRVLVLLIVLSLAVPGGLVAPANVRAANATIEGTVTACGLPLAGVTVTCTSGCNNEGKACSGGGMATTDSSGHYCLDITFGGSSATATIEAAKTGYGSQSRNVKVEHKSEYTGVDFALDPLLEAVDDSITTVEDTAVTIEVLANDSGNIIEVTAVTDGTGGTVTNNRDSVTYTPNTGFAGSDSFTYTITDDCGQTATATVAVEVEAVNHPPTADAGGPYSVVEGGSVMLDGSGSSDPDGDTLTYAWDLDNDGIYECSGVSPTFSAAGLTGPSSVTVGLRVCDGEPLCDADTATVYIEAGQGEGPVAADDSYGTLQDTPKTVGAPGVLGNDCAGECESLSAELVSGPSHGALAGGLAADGSFTYTPDVGFVGTDTFTYKATCGELESNTATVTIHIGATPPPPAPPCMRADVSAIIHGGWDGIAVNASVAGTGQPTKHTAADSSGRAAVLWTFYPPPGATWTVTVTPQLPPGLDPERWTFEPASASASIRCCSEAQVAFQLIDTGGEEPDPAVVLPVTGGEAPQAGWWQGLVRWLRGLLGPVA